MSCSGRIGITISEIYRCPNDSGSLKITLKMFYSTAELADNAGMTWLFRIVYTVISIRCKFCIK